MIHDALPEFSGLRYPRLESLSPRLLVPNLLDFRLQLLFELTQRRIHIRLALGYLDKGIASEVLLCSAGHFRQSLLSFLRVGSRA